MKSNCISAFLTLLIVAASCKGEPEMATTETSIDSDEIIITRDQFNHSQMALGELMEVEFPEIVRANGEVEVSPENLVKINVFEGGYVVRIPKLEGSKVKRGELILSLENPRYVELQQEYLDLSGQLDYLKSEFERQQIMFEENISSQKSFLKAESEYKSGLARYNGLKQKLQMLNIDLRQVEKGDVTSQINIYSPISGTVNRINVSKGAFVEPTSNIMEIVNTDHLHLELNVFEKDLMKIHEGQLLTFKLPQAPLEDYKGEIYLVGKTIGPNRMAGIHAHIADSLGDRFAVGMFVEAQIITSSQKLPALPQQAIVEVNNAHYILVLKENRENEMVFTREEVDPLNTYKGYTALKNIENLTGKSILTKGAFTLIGS